MKRFTCPVCANEVHFENVACVACGTALAIKPGAFVMQALGDHSGNAASPQLPPTLCQNAAAVGCNWLLPEGQGQGFCLACQHNRGVPDPGYRDNLARWAEIELAKRKLIYALIRWNLPHPTRETDPAHGLAFDFLADSRNPDGSMTRISTGHSDGLITLNLDEGDAVSRAERRSALDEPYRTVIGHMRHEIGHYYWTLLIENAGRQDAFRALFGDERQDYAQALELHYTNGPPADWAQSHISAYATAHPWEDFAETWAHWMHIVDGLETARAYGIRLESSVAGRSLPDDPYLVTDISGLIEEWVGLTVALNNMNRGMGQPDLYPFVLSRPVVAKLNFLNGLIHPEMGIGQDALPVSQANAR